MDRIKKSRPETQVLSLRIESIWQSWEKLTTWTLSHQKTLFLILEVTIITAWAVFLSRGYIDFNPNNHIWGMDFPHQIYESYGWYPLRECGLCFLWDGYLNGGQPTFAAVQGAPSHPLIILTTLIWGAVNGAKVTMIVSLILAGIAQWWLAKALGLGSIARTWAGMIAVAGGHIGYRMEDGLVLIVLALVSANLAIPPLIDLVRTRRLRSAVLAGVFLALAVIAGQGYIQIALALGVLPAFVLTCLLGSDTETKLLRRRFIFTLFLAVLLSAILWVPVLHFSPYFVKDGDVYFNSAPPLQTVALNMILQKDNSIYIGWIPVLLALMTMRLVPKNMRKLALFFYLAAAAVFIVSSQNFLRFVYKYIEEASFARFTALMTPLAVSFVIALAAWSLDVIFKANWRLSLSNSSNNGRELRITWILAGLIFFASIAPVYNFSKGWFKVDNKQRPEEVFDWLRTDTVEWVETPYPNYPIVPMMMELNYKITGVFHAWHWKNRELPSPMLQVRTDLPQETGALEGTYKELFLVRYENHYASINMGDEINVCQAKAVGGNIDVTCSSAQPGVLTVQENNFPGWIGFIDGRRAPLTANQNWLQLNAPAGQHVYSFRYRPWDVWVGLGLSLIGVLIALTAWRIGLQPVEDREAEQAEKGHRRSEQE